MSSERNTPYIYHSNGTDFYLTEDKIGVIIFRKFDKVVIGKVSTVFEAELICDTLTQFNN